MYTCYSHHQHKVPHSQYKKGSVSNAIQTGIHGLLKTYFVNENCRPVHTCTVHGHRLERGWELLLLGINVQTADFFLGGGR